MKRGKDLGACAVRSGRKLIRCKGCRGWYYQDEHCQCGRTKALKEFMESMRRNWGAGTLGRGYF